MTEIGEDQEFVQWLRNVQPADKIPGDCLWRVIRLLQTLDAVCVMQAQEIAALQELTRPKLVVPPFKPN